MLRPTNTPSLPSAPFATLPDSRGPIIPIGRPEAGPFGRIHLIAGVAFAGTGAALTSRPPMTANACGVTEEWVGPSPYDAAMMARAQGVAYIRHPTENQPKAPKPVVPLAPPSTSARAVVTYSSAGSSSSSAMNRSSSSNSAPCCGSM